MTVKKLKCLIPSMAFCFILGIALAFSPQAVTRYAQEIKPAGQAGKKTEMVAMRDNVKLATDIFLPDGAGPWPVILMRTPYNKDSMGAMNRQWVSSGYA